MAPLLVRLALQSCTLRLLQYQLLPNVVIFATIVQTVIPVSGSRALSSEFVPRTERYADFGTSVWTILAVRASGPTWWHYLPTGRRAFITERFVRPAARSLRIGLAQAQDGPMLTSWVPTPLFGHLMRQPSPSGGSCTTPLLPGHPSGRCFYLSRLWNRSVFRVYVQLGITVSGARASSGTSSRERSWNSVSSQMQMVTLRQPATIPSLLGHSFDLPIATTPQSEVMWLTIHPLRAVAYTWPILGFN